MPRLEIKAAAERDLSQIFDFSVERFGERTAIDYLMGIRSLFQRILEFPEIGMVSSETRQSIRMVQFRRHRAFYALYKDRIEIVRILHHAMDVPPRLG